MTRLRKFFLPAAALILLASLLTSFLHHHSEGQDLDQCIVCKFVRQIVTFLFFAVLIFFRNTRPEFVIQRSARPPSLHTSSRLRNRAPPFFS